MAFTDDDLKRLKLDLAANRRMEWPMPDCEAFVARLEAAEAALEPHKDGCGVQTDFDCDCDMGDRLKAWRKAAGK